MLTLSSISSRSAPPWAGNAPIIGAGKPGWFNQSGFLFGKR